VNYMKAERGGPPFNFFVMLCHTNLAGPINAKNVNITLQPHFISHSLSTSQIPS
jgi:hypothetical protein